jgi:hypothetical protein
MSTEEDLQNDGRMRMLGGSALKPRTAISQLVVSADAPVPEGVLG